MSANISKIVKPTYLLVFLFNIFLFGNPTYKMSVEDLRLHSTKSIEASVYIENVGDPFTLTSYQCAFRINQELDLTNLSFEYVEGTTQLANQPISDLGVYNYDGITELTFVSYIGNDLISSKTRVGTFILELNFNIIDILALDLQWDFDGSISTIITGEGFANITNPSSHVSVFPQPEKTQEVEQISIVSSVASDVYGDKFTSEMLYDGIHSMSNGGEYSPSSDGRWAVSGFPQWVTFDLGEETYVDHIKVDSYDSEKGTYYECEFYAGDYDNKTLVVSGNTETGVQWSEYDMNGVKTRYVTMVVTDGVGNNWCDFWELEIFGSNSTTDVEDEEEIEEVVDEETIPSEYGISQNYPNPFNPTTKIEVKMKENGSARLDVYNLIGERVLAVLDNELSAGVHEVNIDGSSLASGIYIYKLSIGNKFTQIKKMNLIK